MKMAGNISACNLAQSRTKTSLASNDVVYLTAENQKEVLMTKLLECYCEIEQEPYKLTGNYCERTWDNAMCWRDTPAGTTAQQHCPSYINTFNTQEFATRTCLPNGTWYVHPTLNSGQKGWTNFSACPSTENKPKSSHTIDVPYLIIKHLDEFRIMYNVGYGLSLISLIVAFSILLYFKKLHCARTMIHLNLFASFMFRAAISLIRDNFMVAGLGFPNDVAYNSTEGTGIYFKDGSHWECRLFFSIFQYVIAASYIWIFVEALFIHMLIFVSVFTEKIKVVCYMLFGWLFPFVIVTTWCTTRLLLDNSFCWNTHTNRPGLTWIIQGPIMLTVVLNLVFFINLVRVLYTKLSQATCPGVKKYKYRRLTRSTLFMIPVFGVYYILFTLPLHDLDDTLEFVLLFIEMFFNSYQGFFISLFLCFLNTEVRREISRKYRQIQERRGSHLSTYHLTNRKCSLPDKYSSGNEYVSGLKSKSKSNSSANGTNIRLSSNTKCKTKCEETPFLTETTDVHPQVRGQIETETVNGFSDNKQNGLLFSIKSNNSVKCDTNYGNGYVETYTGNGNCKNTEITQRIGSQQCI